MSNADDLISWRMARMVLLSGGIYPAWLIDRCIESMRHAALLGDAEAQQMEAEWDQRRGEAR